MKKMIFSSFFSKGYPPFLCCQAERGLFNKRIFEILFIVFIGGCLTCPVKGQVVYPGDVNNNGLVNGIDVLYLGLVIGKTGPERDRAIRSNEFIPQAIVRWEEFLPNGLDLAYADCNGDGVISVEDITDAIEPNFGLRHGNLDPDEFSEGGVPGTNVFFGTTPDAPTFSGGQSVSVDFSLGTEELPVQDFYGIAFTVHFDTNLIADGDIQFEVDSGGWVDPTRSVTSNLVVTQRSAGTLDVALTRTDLNTVDGFGSLGTLSFIIIDDVVLAVSPEDVYQVEDIKVAGLDFTDIMITTDTLTTATQTPNKRKDIRVFPNPARSVVQLSASNPSISWLRLINPQGQLLLVQEFPVPVRQTEIRTNQLPTGIYFLQVKLDNHLVSRKIWIKRE